MLTSPWGPPPCPSSSGAGEEEYEAKWLASPQLETLHSTIYYAESGLGSG